jgi:hypothetical protein
MKKLIFLFIIIVLFIPVVAYAQTATPTLAPNGTSVTVIGDSLTTVPGAGRKLTESLADINLYSEIGRSWAQGLDTLTEVKNAGNLKDVLVFALGTNGGVSQANIESLIAAAAGKNIILMTIYRENVDWLETTNQAINSAATNPNVKIADWYTLASAHPEWFGTDGTHPSSSGYSAMADLIIEAIDSSGPNLTGTPNEGRSNCIITKVGNPIGVAPVCPTDSNQNNNPVVGPCGPLLTWAQTVNDSLEYGAPDPSTALHLRYYNRQMSNLFNCSYTALIRDGQAIHVNDLIDDRINHWYWCTYIVIDSFNLVGLKGGGGETLDLTQADVRDLHVFMDSTPGFQFVDYRTDQKNALARVRPGYAFFVEACFKSYCQGGAHTGIIKSIDIDTHGNGTIITLESNSTHKSHTWAVAEWDVINPDYAGRPLVGFGGPI